MTRTVETPEYHAMQQRMIRAYGRRVGRGDVESLADLVSLRADLEGAITEAVHALRSDEGGAHSWAEIARVLGITPQAAQKRYRGEGARQVGGQPAHLR